MEVDAAASGAAHPETPMNLSPLRRLAVALAQGTAGRRALSAGADKPDTLATVADLSAGPKALVVDCAGR
jgi:hypothetical protein